VVLLRNRQLAAQLTNRKRNRQLVVLHAAQVISNYRISTCFRRVPKSPPEL
jgi:hypothetical protein